MFLLASLQNQTFSLVSHSCRWYSTHFTLVSLVSHSCRTRVALVLPVLHSCCIRVSRVVLVSLVSGTRVKRVSDIYRKSNYATFLITQLR